MYTLLQEGVQTGIINASGAVITLGGLALVAAWVYYLGR
jgi:hypothetical protein